MRMRKMLTFLALAGISLSLSGASVSGAPAEEMKESGYVIKITEKNIYLSKVPLHTEHSGKPAQESSEAAGEAQVVVVRNPKEGDGAKKAKESEEPKKIVLNRTPNASDGQGDKPEASDSRTISFSLNMFSITRDTIIEEGIEKGDKVTVFYTKEVETAISTRVVPLK